MTLERWQQIERLYHEALARDASERGPFLASACGGDELLQHEVESLLAQPVSAAGPLDGAAAALVSDIAMPLATGTRIGVYAVQGLLGKGGMGEVYRAHDSRLGRDVAIKILPAAFTSDPDRLARFEREARVLASLNHPNIATIHGLEEAGPTRAIVMEMVDGETLATRVGRAGALPLADVLAIGREIADALDAAHEKGIVHRDLKPANIIVSKAGIVKVLDFGLARIGGEAGEASEATTAAATRDGMILGTAAYMSPEQARGQTVDKRTDVWAFGCVVFELLTGRAAFEGATVSDTLAAVLERKPDWSRLPAEVPPALRRLLARCLEKNPKRRARDIGDVRHELDEATAVPDMPATRPAWRERALWIAATIVLLAVTVGLVMLRLDSGRVAPRETRVDIVTPPTSDPFSVALSPDGRHIAFVAADGDVQRLWIRSLDRETASALSGTEGASFPFWSPDSAAIGFFADGALKVVAATGGSLRALTIAAPRGGAWGEDGTILFARNSPGPLWQIRATGGEPVPVTELQAEHLNHRFPQFLPDGRRFLFFVQGTSASEGIYLGSLDRSPARRLVAGHAAGVLWRGDWLVFGRSGVLLAQRLNLPRGEVTGDPINVADSVAMDVYRGAIAVTAGADGLLAYRTGAATRQQLTWFDRTGRVLGVASAANNDSMVAPRLSPDEGRIALFQTIQQNTDVWILEGDQSTRLTFDPEIDRIPIWSPDGSRILFESNRSGLRNLYEKHSDLSTGDQILLQSPKTTTPEDWSRDGRFISYTAYDPQTLQDIWVMPMEGTRTPFEFLRTAADERSPTFSPDGEWVAYVSNVSGSYQIYVRPFRGSGSERQISVSGGIHPHWAQDGSEIYYVAPNGMLMAAPLRRPQPGLLERGRPQTLFQGRMYGGSDLNVGRNFDVSRDGRFLLNTILESAPPITLLRDWAPERP